MSAQILVIDDSATMRKLVQIAFRGSDYAIDFASSGKEGIDRAVSMVPDVILLDYMLPDMKGIDVCHQLAMRSETAGVGIIVMSGKPELGPTFANVRNVVSFLAKPFTPEAVTTRLRAALKRGDHAKLRTARIPVIPYAHVAPSATAGEKAPLILQGDLASCPVFDLLRLLGAFSATGELVADTLRIYVHGGRVLMCVSTIDEIEADRRIPDEIVESARQAQRDGKPALVTFAEHGYGNDVELVPLLKGASQRHLERAIALRSGRFDWRPDVCPPYVEAFGRAISVTAAGLDHARTRAGTPAADLEQIYQRTPRFSDAIVGLKLTSSERVILTAIDGVASLRDLTERTKIPARQLLQTIGQLAAIDLVTRVESSQRQHALGATPILVHGLDTEFVTQLRTLLARRPVPIDIVEVAKGDRIETVVARATPQLILVGGEGGFPSELRALARLTAATVVAILEVGDTLKSADSAALGIDAALFKPVHIAEIERLLGH
ncbi:MAG: response regulator [Kofleriaceae bacterium]